MEIRKFNTTIQNHILEIRKFNTTIQSHILEIRKFNTTIQSHILEIRKFNRTIESHILEIRKFNTTIQSSILGLHQFIVPKEGHLSIMSYIGGYFRLTILQHTTEDKLTNIKDIKRESSTALKSTGLF